MKLASKLIVAAVALLWVSAVALAAAPDHKYIGAQKCKICHKIQHTSWLATKHAKAFETLKPAEQKDPKCYQCHVTDNDAAMVGVQCEQCHGPGSDYQGLKVMKDRAASIAAGLILPTKEVCVQCHNSKSPNFKGFNFDEAVKKVHEHKPKA